MGQTVQCVGQSLIEAVDIHYDTIGWSPVNPRFYKHRPRNAQYSEPSDLTFREQWGLGISRTPIGWTDGEMSSLSPEALARYQGWNLWIPNGRT